MKLRGRCPIYVKKGSGEREEFDPEKIKRTCLRAGASESLAEKIADKVESEAYDGITTKKILNRTLQLLEEEPGVAMRYNLKNAIMDLGPSGFPFEKFVSEVLQKYGYETKVGVILEGECVPQEVDVIAEKGGKRYLVECKFHNAVGIYTGLKVMMYTHSRFLDLEDKFHQAWLITNTKCSGDAKRYAKCVGNKVTSWNYPEENLRKMIESKKIYPVTILKSVNPSLGKKLIGSNLVLVRDIAEHSVEKLGNMTGLSRSILGKIKGEAGKII